VAPALSHGRVRAKRELSMNRCRRGGARPSCRFVVPMPIARLLEPRTQIEELMVSRSGSARAE